MTPIEPPLPSGTKVCLIKPNVGLSTPAVFKALDYDTLSKDNPEACLEEFITKGVQEAFSYINDLEPPKKTCVPLLASLKEELQQVEGFQHVFISGSGGYSGERGLNEPLVNDMVDLPQKGGILTHLALIHINLLLERSECIFQPVCSTKEHHVPRKMPRNTQRMSWGQRNGLWQAVL